MYIYIGGSHSTGAAPSKHEIQTRNPPKIMSKNRKFPPNGPALEIIWM
jgi:hypothetical protein